MPTLVFSRDLPFAAPPQIPEGIELHTVVTGRSPTPEELRAALARPGVLGLITMLSDKVDAALMDAAPDLRVVANYAVGYDNFDLDAARARGITMTNTPDVLTEATADIAFALLLSLARRVREGERIVRAGEFHGWQPDMLLGTDLAGRTFGVFGLGRIGQATARRARGFGMRVIYAGRSAAPADVCEALDATRVDLDELIRRSDVLSLHCPLTRDTRHLIDADALRAMKPSALLINTARGPVVDEAALGAALEAGEIRGAGLDVYEQEPAVHPSLLGRDDVVLLPHLGSATIRTRAEMAELALENALRVMRGEPAITPIG